MPIYLISGKYQHNDRATKRKFPAYTEEQARIEAESEGIVIEEILEMQPEPPTDKQMRYALDLGVSVPSTANKLVVSALIDAAVSGDSPTPQELLEAARAMNIYVYSSLIGKNALSRLIWCSLIEESRHEEMMYWFLFRVLAHIQPCKDLASLSPSIKKELREMAKELAEDKKVLSSAKRYRGDDLLRFRSSPNYSPENRAGSTQTAAYKAAILLIESRLGITLTKNALNLQQASLYPLHEKRRKNLLAALLYWRSSFPLEYWRTWSSHKHQRIPSESSQAFVDGRNVNLRMVWLGQAYAYRDHLHGFDQNAYL
jgi:hypothetical protein